MPPNAPASSRRSRAGFSLVEVSVAMAVTVVALTALVSSMLASARLHRTSQETAIAQRAAAQVLERMQGIPFAEIFAAYNGVAADDAGLSVVAPGANFAVARLDPRVGDADGRCGEVRFPIAVAAGGLQELREDVVDAAWGMPRDLDLDGARDALDHAGNYRLLPVRIVVRWRGIDGERQLQLETVLCER